MRTSQFEMIIFSNTLYRKLTIGLITLPLLMFGFCRIEYWPYAWSSWHEPLQNLLAVLYFGCLFWLLITVFKIANLEKRSYQFVIIPSLAFGSLIGAIFGRLNVHGYGVLLLLGHVLFTWPVCVYWLIYLLFSKPDPEL